MNTDTELLRKLVELAREVCDTDPFEAPTSVEKAAIGQFVLEHIPEFMALSRLLEAPAQAPGWIPCSERMPPDQELVLVYTPLEDGSYRYDQDYREEGTWGFHYSSYEHFQAVGGARAAGPDAVCTGPDEDAPYTHWMPLPAPPASPGEGT